MKENENYNQSRNNQNVSVNGEEGNMSKRATIKDIAELAGVSLGTVHCALNGKRGVGEETRQRVLEIARRCNYHPNTAAASLKRKTVRIAVAFPGLTEDNRFYFTYFWSGFREYLKSMKDFNVEVLEVPFYLDSNSLKEELEDLYQNTEVQGLICATGYMDQSSKGSLQRFVDKGIPVALVGEDIPHLERLCCVQPNYDVIGRTITELLIREIPKESGILVCAGDVLIPSHYKIVLGMDAYIEEHELHNRIYKVHAGQSKKDEYQHIIRELAQKDDIKACFAVTARSSVLLGKALEETGKTGIISAVGSDMFAENMEFLRSGIFTNLLNKNPYSQAYTAAKYLVEYLLKGSKPPKDTVYVGSEVVFQSSLPMYEADGQNRLFL